MQFGLFIRLCCTRSGKAECLYNIPVSVGMLSRSTSTRPLDELCLRMAGQSAQPCYNHTSDPAVCSGVWCKTSAAEHCVLFQGPDTDGLTCGTQKVKIQCVLTGAFVAYVAIPQICMNGTCVVGGWGKWSAFSSCSATCGQGLQYQERHCLG